MFHVNSERNGALLWYIDQIVTKSISEGDDILTRKIAGWLTESMAQIDIVWTDQIWLQSAEPFLSFNLAYNNYSVKIPFTWHVLGVRLTLLMEWIR